MGPVVAEARQLACSLWGTPIVECAGRGLKSVGRPRKNQLTPVAVGAGAEIRRSKISGCKHKGSTLQWPSPVPFPKISRWGLW